MREQGARKHLPVSAPLSCRLPQHDVADTSYEHIITAATRKITQPATPEQQEWHQTSVTMDD